MGVAYCRRVPRGSLGTAVHSPKGVPTPRAPWGVGPATGPIHRAQAEAHAEGRIAGGQVGLDHTDRTFPYTGVYRRPLQ